MLTVNLAPELEDEVRQNAAERGQDADKYLGQLINMALRRPVPPIIPAQISTEEFIRRMRTMGRAVDPSVPPLSDEATRRESLYEHG